MPLRSLLDRIKAATSPASTPPAGSSVLDRYVRVGPSPQVAVDLFAGTWSSALPLDGVTSGPVPLFADARVAWALEHLGPVAGRSVLELGPLEAGHTYQLTKAGASVVAIEAQTTAYLKCLVVKELLGITGARFLLGDFLEHMRVTPDRYDVCFASGVLYHLRSPVEALALAARVSSRLVLWTHYYDEGVMTGSDLLRPRIHRARGGGARRLRAHPAPVRVRERTGAQGVRRRQRGPRQLAVARGPAGRARAPGVGGGRNRLRRPRPPARPGARPRRHPWRRATGVAGAGRRVRTRRLGAARRPPVR
ncbi:DUF1698 domain-containing protein [Actinosynnema sp. NPDC050436]|uniref:class I SAM-dependent methyltransferase n=1 Tax=Actinosynnema sp. NPDC050436 TaxID=3155659 RepID=UPI0033C5A701